MSPGEIASALVKIRGVWFDVYIDPDHDAKPEDYECYRERDIAAWSRDEWRFVGVTVVLNNHPTIRESLWAVEYGDIDGTLIDMSKIINEHPVPDMISGLRAQVVKILADWEE